LAGLARAILEKLKKMTPDKNGQLASAIYRSLQSKDLLFFFKNSTLQQTVSTLNWHGGVQQLGCLGSCLADYLMVVEANVGVNKVNYYVTRRMEMVSRINETIVKNELVIDYENTSPAEVFPGGRYRNYLRLFLPQTARVEKVLIDGEEIEKKNWEESKFKDKSVVGFLVEVPIKSRKRVEVFYQTATLKVDSWPLTYSLYWQKQPGVLAEIGYRVILDESLTAVEFKPAAQTTGGKDYHFVSTLDRDLSFESYLTK
jgi:hypothetical protein